MRRPLAAYRFQRWYRRLNENHTKNILGCHASFPSVPRDTSPPARSKKLARRVRGRAGVVPSVIRLVRIGLFFLDDICSLHLGSVRDRPSESLLSYDADLPVRRHSFCPGKQSLCQFALRVDPPSLATGNVVTGTGSSSYGSFRSQGRQASHCGSDLRNMNSDEESSRRLAPLRAGDGAASVPLPR